MNKKIIFRSLHDCIDTLTKPDPNSGWLTQENYSFLTEILSRVHDKNIMSEDLTSHQDPKYNLIQENFVANQVIFEHSFGESIGKSFSSLQTIIAYANNVHKTPYGNCLELAIYAFVCGLELIMPKNSSLELQIIFFGGLRQSHFAIKVVDLKNKENSLICDPWAGVIFPQKYLSDIQAFEHDSTIPNKIYPENFTAGIYGDQANYVYFSLALLRGVAIRAMHIIESRQEEAIPGSSRKLYLILKVKAEQDIISACYWNSIRDESEGVFLGPQCPRFNTLGELIDSEKMHKITMIPKVQRTQSGSTAVAHQELKDAHQIKAKGIFGALDSLGIFKKETISEIDKASSSEYEVETEEYKHKSPAAKTA